MKKSIHDYIVSSQLCGMPLQFQSKRNLHTQVWDSESPWVRQWILNAAFHYKVTILGDLYLYDEKWNQKRKVLHI